MMISIGARIECPVMDMEACRFGWGYDRVAEFKVGNKLLLMGAGHVCYLNRAECAYFKFKWDT